MAGWRTTAASVVIGVLAGAGAARSMTLGEREFTCPADGKPFKATVQLSGTTFGRDLDMRPVGPIATPEPLPVCPGVSGFPVYQRSFTAGETARIRSIVQTGAYKDLIRTGQASYFVAAYVQKQLGDDPAAVAGSLLSATWQAEAGSERHRTYARAARDGFATLAATPGTARHGTAAAIVTMARFLQAEMSRQAGYFDTGRALLERWFPRPGSGKGALPPEFIVQERQALASHNADPVQVEPDRPRHGPQSRM